MWCIPELDEEYIERMEDVLEVYERPLSTKEPVVCVDEKAVVLHSEVREPVPMKPGSLAKRDSEYERGGTVNAFCAVEPKAGVHLTKITPTRSSPEFARFVESIANRYPEAETIHLVMDNLSTHTRKALVDTFGEEKGNELWGRFTIHYTPVHGSWLNQAELEIGLFSKAMPRQPPDRRSRDSTSRSSGLEPKYQSETHQDQLDLRSQKGQEKIQI
jgi:hypothetical protein